MSRFPNPNYIVPTPPAGDSSNRAANTQFVATAISNAIGSTAFTASLATKAGTTQADFISGIIQTPTNKDYRLIEFVPFAQTFTKFVASLTTGSLSAILKIGSGAVTTAITGGTLSVIGTTQVSTTPSAINTAALGSALVLTIGTASNASSLNFTVTFTRTLATT